METGSSWFSKRWGTLLSALVVLLTLLSHLTVSAQGEVTYVTIQHVEGFPTISAYVTAADQNGRPVRNIPQREFVVEEDGQNVPGFSVQEIERWESISVVLALDTSGSMNGQLIVDAKNAAQDFIVGLEPGDHVALISFNKDVAIEANFTSTHSTLLESVGGLEALPPGTGATLLYQAAFDAVQKAAEGEVGHRLVLLLTDGEDVDSPVTLDDVIFFAQRKSVPIFVVVIDDGGNPAFISKMERLAQETGGILYKVERGHTEGLTAEFAAISDLLRWQYLITYTSTLHADEGLHTLSIRVCQEGTCSAPGERTFLASSARGPTPVPAVATPPPAPQQLTVDVIVYVDENNNKVWEPDEGIANVNIRIVNPNTNETVLEIRTDEVGHANFRIFMEHNMRLIIYYVGGFSVELSLKKPPTGPIVLRVPPVSLPGAIP